MKIPRTGILTGLIVLLLVMMSCAIPGKSAEVDLTSVAQTVAIELTARVASPATDLPPGSTAEPVLDTPVPDATLTDTPVPSSTATVTQTITNTPIPCNKASFQGYITIPDDKEITAGTNCNKT